jgi:hypothetical protein
MPASKSEAQTTLVSHINSNIKDEKLKFILFDEQ